MEEFQKPIHIFLNQTAFTIKGGAWNLTVILVIGISFGKMYTNF